MVFDWNFLTSLLKWHHQTSIKVSKHWQVCVSTLHHKNKLCLVDECCQALLWSNRRSTASACLSEVVGRLSGKICTVPISSAFVINFRVCYKNSLQIWRLAANPPCLPSTLLTKFAIRQNKFAPNLEIITFRQIKFPPNRPFRN